MDNDMGKPEKGTRVKKRRMFIAAAALILLIVTVAVFSHSISIS